jgi:hypothetical protein
MSGYQGILTHPHNGNINIENMAITMRQKMSD